MYYYLYYMPYSKHNHYLKQCVEKVHFQVIVIYLQKFLKKQTNLI